MKDEGDVEGGDEGGGEGGDEGCGEVQGCERLILRGWEALVPV